jgi:hypothetical protein
VSHQARLLLTLLIGLFFLISLAACGRRGTSEDGFLLGSDNTLSGNATLICSMECSERAQCGLTDDNPTVLLNSSGPATSNHDLAFAAGTEVIIDHQEMLPVIQVSDQSAYRAAFYQVLFQENGSGWVAGWCLGQQP